MTSPDRSPAPGSQIAEERSGRVERLGPPMRIVSVQQYENKIPIVTDDGQPSRPQWITVVRFETSACSDARDDHFKLRVMRKAQASLAGVEILKAHECSQPIGRIFQVSTSQLVNGEAFIVTNPVVVEMIAPAE